VSRDRQPVQLKLFEQETKDISTVSRILNVSDQTIRRLLRKGLLRGYRRHSRGWWQIYVRSLIEYEQKLRQEYPPEPPK
jgi:hypothetical protein